MELSIFRRQMKKRSELETKQVYNILMDTSGRSNRLIRSMFDIYNNEHTNKHVHAFYY